MSLPIDVVLIAGSPSSVSRSTAALQYLDTTLEARRLRNVVITVRDLPAESLLTGQANDPAITAAIEQVIAARVVVVATPIYKAAYSGTLKTFLDLLPQDALADKTVLPLATGGSLAHLLAIDYGLKPVLSALGARHILAGVFLPDALTPKVAALNGYTLLPEATERLGAAAETLEGILRRKPSLTVSGSRDALTLAKALL